MRNHYTSIRRSAFLIICMAVAITTPSFLTQPACAQTKDEQKATAKEKTLSLSVLLPNGKPAKLATVVRHAQFSNGKPAWVSQRLGEGRQSKPLIGDKDGLIRWTNFEAGRSSKICMILSADKKFGTFFPLGKVNLKTIHKVNLSRLIPLTANFKNPLAQKKNLPFLHRGYLYLGTGERFAHVVGETARIFLPEGFYEMTGYNGNGHNILVDIPKFRFQFVVGEKSVSKVLIVEGEASYQKPEKSAAEAQDATLISIGTFLHADGEIAFPPNKLLEGSQGKNSVRIAFRGSDGKPYRGKQVFVRDLNERNQFIYYGKMPESGILDLGKIAAGKYRIEVDSHSPAAVYRLEVKDGKELAIKQPVVMPVMPGYTLDDLHLLDPVSFKKRDLKGFRGKVVYIEFWASWCGPCMQAMNHVEAILSKRKATWGDKVALVAVNVNEKPAQTIKKYTAIYGWKSFDHLYGGDKERFDFKAPALKQLQINGIPHAMILGKDGKMIWRGHPESIDVGIAIEKALLEDKR